MPKPKTLYRFTIQAWSDSPMDLDALQERIANQNPDLYWVFGDEEELEKQEEFPNTQYFDID